MAISNKQLEYTVTLTKEGASPIEVACRGDYTKECGTCGEATYKSKNIALTASQKTQLKNFGIDVVLADIEAEEG